MKKLCSILLICIISQVGYSQIININKTFSNDTTIYPFNGISQSFGLKISGHIDLKSDTSLVRTILITDSGDEFMVYEAYPLIENSLSIDFLNKCDETCLFEATEPIALRFEIIDAEITVISVYSSPNAQQNASVLQYQNKRNNDIEKIEILAANVIEKGYQWVPGDNGIVQWFYSQKKLYWGEKYNLMGYDYYTGGIYESPGVEYANVTYNPYVDVWDWRNRHGANDPSSPYFDDDDSGFTGWITPIKNQAEPTGCGSCSAFGTFGSFEAMINLYYNQHLDLDLSEQEQLSCNPLIDCGGGHPIDIFPYIRDNGVLTEECFPYLADDEIECDDENYQCEVPDVVVSLSQYEEHTEGNFSWNQIQEMLITKGPLVWIKNGGQHAITIIGYIYDDQNEKLYLIQKESMGEDWGFNNNGILIEPAPVNYLYVGAALDATVTTNNPPTVQIKDEDGDGYDNWGIGPRPSGASVTKDCDDSNPSYSSFSSDYSCTCVGQYSNETITIGFGQDIYWSDNMVLNKDVYVKYGGKLTISSKIMIHKSVDFIVEPGGQLFIDGGHLTKACDDFWKGIEIWGDISKPQLNTQTPWNIYSNQGRVSITNGGIIEYAKIGLLTGAYDNEIYDYSKSGGIIKSVDATFRNNEVGIKFLSYYDPISIINWSVIKNTTFLTYDNEVTLFHFNTHLDIEGIYGLKIIGSDFIFKFNQVISTASDDKGIGILAKDSHFTVEPQCISYGSDTHCNEYDSCSFVNLRYGIKAFNSGSNSYVQIYKSVFDECVSGIYLSGHTRAKIISNDFNTHFAERPVNEEFYGGLYLDGCTGYHIENNNFHSNYQAGVFPSDKSIGLYIKDSGDEDNEIYNNFFHNLDIAIIAEGINKGESSGLTIKCNDLWDNGNDIFVINNPDAMVFSRYEGIKYMQGADSDQTQNLIGNTFTSWFNGIDPSGENAFWSYKNNLDHFDYFHHQRNDIPRTYPLDENYTDETITLYEKELISFDKGVACPPRVGGGGSATTMMATAGSNIITFETKLADLTDGGDTQATNDSIIFSIQGEGLELRDQLLEESPYLSDTVIKSAIAKENVLPNAMLRDVLVANPHSSKNEEILIATENRSDPVPGYMMNEILEGLEVVDAKELIESKLAHWQGEYHRALNDLGREYLSDSTNKAPLDSLENLLLNEDDLISQYKLALVYLDKRDTAGAINLINNIPSNFELNAYQISLQEAYVAYFEVLEYMYNNHLNAVQLDSTAIASLIEIGNMHLPVVSAYSTGMLVRGGHIDFTERVALPGTKKAARIYPDDRPPFESELSSQLSLMPNPAKNHVIIGYDLGSENGQGIILVRDAKGTLIKYLGLHNSVNQITVGLDNVPSGIYIVSLYSGSNHIASKQLSIAQ